MDAGRYPSTPFGSARQTSGRHGYVAYFPSPIPRALDLPTATVAAMGDAEAALGRLEGVVRLTPQASRMLSRPAALIRPYLLREAVSSTRIEGTQASIGEMLELDAAEGRPNADVEEVLAYVDALQWGLQRLSTLPISVRLLRELHTRVMAGERGVDKTPGDLRTTQNWIGAVGDTIETARFVPPPPDRLADLLSDWERYAHEVDGPPVLIRNAILHCQFEAIHPFLDGNGRLGRLLLILFLAERRRLSQPVLHVSAYLERDRERYYRALQTVHEDGDPIPWVDLFLEAVAHEAEDAVARAERLFEVRERYRDAAAAIASANALALVDVICTSPVVTTRVVERQLSVTRPTALTLLRRLESVGVLTESEPGARGQRRYVARELMEAVLTDN